MPVPADMTDLLQQHHAGTAGESYAGCFLGLALGDALCAPYEGGILERALWKLIGRTRTGKRRYTDDTRMGMDVAESLLANKGVNQEHLAETFAASYRWSRGYGIGSARMLKKIRKGAGWQEVNRSVFPDGSYGNGAAMRAPIAALYFYGNDTLMIHAVDKISEITHAHPLAVEGARLIALSTAFALSQADFSKLFELVTANSRVKEFQIRINIAGRWIEDNTAVDSATVVRQLGNGVAAIDSCVTALYIASRYIDRPFADMLNFIQQCSGDTDTIGAMAGAIWGARNGLNGLNRSDVETVESASLIEQLSERLYENHLIS